MSQKPTMEEQESIPQNTAVAKFSVPVRITDMSLYEGAFANMKERFASEMRRIDEEMTSLSKKMLNLYGQTTTVQTGMTSSTRESTPNSPNTWEAAAKSPLVEGEGENKVLNLQFDVSEFDQSEVSVKIANDMLTVSAIHEETTNSSTNIREFNREFILPVGTDPESVESSLSKDGVLMVRVPWHIAALVESTVIAIENPSQESNLNEAEPNENPAPQ